MSLRLNSTYYVADHIAQFPAAQASLYLLALLSLSIIVVGVLTLQQTKSLAEQRQRARLITLGLMYIFTGLTVEYIFLFLQGNNTSSLVVVGYAVTVLSFVLGLFFVGRKSSILHK